MKTATPPPGKDGSGLMLPLKHEGEAQSRVHLKSGALETQWPAPDAGREVTMLLPCSGLSVF